MIPFVLRQVWRLIIFILGAFSLQFLITTFWPESDNRFAVFSAFLIIYCLMAYVFIPMLFRIYRILIRPNHIPLYVTTGDGWAADPVNIAVVARSERDFIRAMKKAGWHTADKATFKNSIREAYAIIFNRPYLTAPFSNLYLFGRGFELGFQKPGNNRNSPRSRHHVRFWRLDSEVDTKTHIHMSFWHNHLKHLLGLDKQVWVGAAIDDTGPIGLRWRYGQITHKNNTDTNAERDLIVADLESAGQVYSQKVIRAGNPFSFHGQTLGNRFLCDGTIKVVGLRRPMNAQLHEPLPVLPRYRDTDAKQTDE